MIDVTTLSTAELDALIKAIGHERANRPEPQPDHPADNNVNFLMSPNPAYIIAGSQGSLYIRVGTADYGWVSFVFSSEHYDRFCTQISEAVRRLGGNAPAAEAIKPDSMATGELKELIDRLGNTYALRQDRSAQFDLPVGQMFFFTRDPIWTTSNYQGGLLLHLNHGMFGRVSFSFSRKSAEQLISTWQKEIAAGRISDAKTFPQGPVREI